VDVQRIASGLWCWTAFHEEWKEEVGSVYCETADGVVLIDPLVPMAEAAQFWEALERDVAKAGGEVHVLVTVFWHTRSTKQIVERYNARVWARARGKQAVARRAGSVSDPFRKDDPLPGGIQAFETARASEVVYWLSDDRTVVPGDVLLGDGNGGVRLCPQSWLPQGRTQADLADSLRPLLDLPVQRVLTSHGESPCSLTGARPSPPRWTNVWRMPWFWIVAGVVVLLLLVLVYGYNRLVRLRQEVNTGWANIDVQLQRRADLIPNLVETVRGYAAHERATFEEVTQARIALQRAGSPAAAAAADEGLTAALGKLFAVAEAYPDLQASKNFLELQDELTDTEDKISAARRYYNATVMHFNTATQTFPWLLVALPLGFRAREFFAAEGDTAAPEISFAS
jgi:LemA protein